MCDNVIIHQNDSTRTATTQAELAELIGRENIVMDEGGVSPSGAFFEAAEFYPDDCLCPVNLPASAEKTGFRHSQNDAEGQYDPFDVHWYQP